jgi:hypothetical protein
MSDKEKIVSNHTALELQLKQARAQILRLQHELADRDAVIAQLKAEIIKVEASKLDMEMTSFLKENDLEDGASLVKNSKGEWEVKSPPAKP